MLLERYANTNDILFVITARKYRLRLSPLSPMIMAVVETAAPRQYVLPSGASRVDIHQ